MVVKTIKNWFEKKPEQEQKRTNKQIQENQEALNRSFEDIREQRLSYIISKFEELLNNKDIIANLKQSRKHTEFQEQVKNIIQNYYDNKHDSATTVKVEAKLKKLDEWCEETIEKDSTPIWKNIGNVIKHAFNAVKNIGKAEKYNKEKQMVNYYIDAVKNAKQNTKEAAKEILDDPLKSTAAQRNLKKPNFKSH